MAADAKSNGRDGLKTYIESTLKRLQASAPSIADLREKAMPSVTSSIQRMVAGAPAELKNKIHETFLNHEVLPEHMADLESFKSALGVILKLVTEPQVAASPSKEIETDPQEVAEAPAAHSPIRRRQFERQDTLGHHLRGISVHYLSTTLIEEVTAAGLDRSARVYEIEPTVIRPKGPVGPCPRDERDGLAYVDCLKEGDAGIATHMLSYTWGYKIGDIVDSLELFCRSQCLHPEDAFFWICCLCINQHRVKEAQAKKEVVPFEKFKQEFGDRVSGIGHVVALMAPWHDPFYTKRVWCDFEMYTAADLGDEKCKISVVMPPAEADDMRKALTSGPLTNPKLWEALQNVKIEQAEASCPEDKDRIFELITESTGFHRLNSIVAKCLQNWIVATCDDILANIDEEMKAGGESAQEAAKTCARMGCVFRDLLFYERAMKTMTRAVELFKTAGLTESLDWGCLMSNFGACKRKCQDLPGALLAFERAEKIYKRLGQTKTVECALLYNSIGAARREEGDIVQSIDAFQQAKEILEDIDMLNSEEGAMVLNSYGAAYRSLGDIPKALSSFEQAKQILEKAGLTARPMACYLENSIGATKKQAQDFKGALEAFERARLIQERLGSHESDSGMQVWLSIASAKRKLKDFDGAQKAVEEARKIGEKAKLMDTDVGRRVQDELSGGKGKGSKQGKGGKGDHKGHGQGKGGKGDGKKGDSKHGAHQGGQGGGGYYSAKGKAKGSDPRP
eukprot:TRINITY_DN11138_c0_g1_i2.p1 TRINITY_DN11138_c0_g1~~TRINITY_DN11138_c0_g1_i2.p1  ORF type:complete len:758 (-),score=171.60 TRINITY_DN11138_c0_g1_i2:108-2318(-)